MDPTYSDHSRVEERSLVMHRLVAAKLRANPAILDVALDNLRRWRKLEGSPALALSEWESILSGPVDQVSRLLEERSERANRLRQSSPFAGALTEAERRAIYESFSTRAFIRAASQISGDVEIVVVGSQAIHAQRVRLPPIAFRSLEADVYPRNHPERADEIEAATGELSQFHRTHGYYAHGIAPTTAILPAGWEQRVVRLSSPNTGGATGLCIEVHDLALSEYAAGREQDIEFNRELAKSGIIGKRRLMQLLPNMPIGDDRERLILDRIKQDFSAANPHRRPRPDV